MSDERGRYVELTLNSGESATVNFELFVKDLSNLSSTVTATAGDHPEYALDGDLNTVYTVSGQTTGNYEAQYIQFELDGKSTVDKLIIKRTILSGESNYWADWCLAVGCELQGSMDGKNWERIYEMSPAPDGTDNSSQLVIEPSDPKPYRYVRYIRTKIKTSGDYGAWKFPGDNGNRLSLTDIEFYGAETYFKAEVTGRDENSVTVCAESSTDRDLNVFAAAYDGGRLTASAMKSVTLEGFIPTEIMLDIRTEGEISVFLWDDSLSPLCEKLSA